MKKTSLLLTIFVAITVTYCDKSSDFTSEQPDVYMNLQPGKWVIYRLDSAKFVNFGQKDTVVRYQAKDVVDASITDNLGRKAWRIVRYMRDSASLNEADWQPTSTYMVVPGRETVEVIENNLRYQKLKLPVSNGFVWKGNSYIDTYSIDSDVRYLFDWDYTYQKVDSSFSLAGTAVPHTVTVQQRDEILGNPSNLDSYSERNYGMEVYAKGVGLVYKNFLHWVFQPRTTTYPVGYKEGYGIKLRMISHN